MKSYSPLSNELSNRAVDDTWTIVLAAKDIIDSQSQISPFGLYYDQTNGTVESTSPNDSKAILSINSHGEWDYDTSIDPQAAALLDLYLPFLSLSVKSSLVVGHLGQSIDAQIATDCGDAFFVTGPENRKHLHRMRALAHAVIVGVETVVCDDPQLTTRDVAGPNPIRVVIDPTARMHMNIGLLTDEAAPTWQLHGPSTSSPKTTQGALLERIEVPLDNNRIKMSDVVSVLAKRGLHRLFVEGGGVTVSGMLNENCLDYLQVATAPVFVGQGRSSIQMPSVLNMNKAFRPSYSLYRMGADVLWNFDVRTVDASASGIDQRTAHNPSMEDKPALERLL